MVITNPENSLNKAKKKVISNIIKGNKTNVKQPIFSAERVFLINSYNNTIAEIKKANIYLAALNHNLKSIKSLLNKVKN